MSKVPVSDKLYAYVLGKVTGLDRDATESKANLAALRNSVERKPEEAMPEVWGVVLEGMGAWGLGREEASYAENAVHHALTLYGIHKQGHSTSMNSKDNYASVGQGARVLSAKEVYSQAALVQRLSVIANSQDIDELIVHLRGLISMMSAAGIALNYPKLAVDLYFMQLLGINKVVFRWARDFYNNKGEN